MQAYSIQPHCKLWTYIGQTGLWNYGKFSGSKLARIAGRSCGACVTENVYYCWWLSDCWYIKNLLECLLLLLLLLCFTLGDPSDLHYKPTYAPQQVPQHRGLVSRLQCPCSAGIEGTITDPFLLRKCVISDQFMLAYNGHIQYTFSAVNLHERVVNSSVYIWHQIKLFDLRSQPMVKNIVPSFSPSPSSSSAGG